MKRFITYIYEYKNGLKCSNAGFIKVDWRKEQCRLEVHIRNLSVKQENVDCYWVIKSSQKSIGIPWGKIEIAQGKADSQVIFSQKTGNNLLFDIEDVLGVAIKGNQTGYLASSWVDEPGIDFLYGSFSLPESSLTAESTSVLEQMPTPEFTSISEQTPTQEENLVSEEIPAPYSGIGAVPYIGRPPFQAPTPRPYPGGIERTEPVPLPQDRQPGRFPSPLPDSIPRPEREPLPESIPRPEREPLSDPILRPEREPLPESIPRSERESLSEPVSRPERELTEDPEQEELQWNEPWNIPGNTSEGRLEELMTEKSRTDMHIQNQRILSENQLRRININDIRQLPSANWHLCNNSFLIHGFFNYKYLVIKEVGLEGRKKYYLGVPGIFEKPERAMALLFGFNKFEPEETTLQGSGNIPVMKKEEHGQDVSDGTFGYWYCLLDM